jgi:protein-tyrosine phosphatase
MIPLVDIHVHLLAGLDDGPRTIDEAVAMCRTASAEGVQAMAATAHQNPRWKDVTPERIREATVELQGALQRERVPVAVYPNAEVMAEPGTPAAWRAGKLLSVGGRGRYLLVEMPRGTFVDLLPTVRCLRENGVRTILAHPEKEPDFLHGDGTIESLIEAGCLVQVSASSVTEPKNREDRVALRGWFKRRMVHLLASDGHSPVKRPPRMAEAHREICRWVGGLAADRIAGGNGMAILNGERVRTAPPLQAQRSWFSVSSWW